MLSCPQCRSMHRPFCRCLRAPVAQVDKIIINSQYNDDKGEKGHDLAILLLDKPVMGVAMPQLAPALVKPAMPAKDNSAVLSIGVSELRGGLLWWACPRM